MILSEAEVQAIRARYPSKRVHVSVHTDVHVSKPERKYVKKAARFARARTASECWHWCPVGRHNWCHHLGERTAFLDEWKKICPEHS